MCDFPVTVRNPNKIGKLGYSTMEVPCGKCAACLQRRANQWSLRLHYQQKVSINAHFITLTYANPPRTDKGLFTACKTDLQSFFKRLRERERRRKYVFNPAYGMLHANYMGAIYTSSLSQGIKYYACSEYGEKYQRPHYHAIVFGVDDERNYVRSWDKGQIDIGTVTPESIAYVAGYIGKRIIPYTDPEEDDRLKEFSLMSKNMGLTYIDHAATWHEQTMNAYTVLNGIKYALPRYYKEKIFPPEYVEVEHFAKLKQLVKKKIVNPKFIHLSKQAYEQHLLSEAREARNFDSLVHWRKNCEEIAQTRNSKLRHFVNGNF